MGKQQEEEDCTRKAIEIDGENYYIVVGDVFVIPTVPRENDPLMTGTRKIVETLCLEISGLMERRKNAQDARSATIAIGSIQPVALTKKVNP